MSVQLVQKNKTQSFKALDQTLSTQSRETGEKESMSYKCLEMDKAVPSLMGVSKARLFSPLIMWLQTPCL